MGKRSDFFYVILIFLIGCTTTTVEDIMDADREFSIRSAEAGMKRAFLEFADDSAVLLRPNVLPIIGKEAIEQSHMNLSDSGFTLTWMPVAGDISTSGDLGYTYGFYSMVIKSDSNVLKGTYLSIWKKQEDGSWKYVLDTGNEGL